MNQKDKDFAEFLEVSKLKNNERASYCRELRDNIQQLTASMINLRNGKDSLSEKFFDECIRVNLDALKTIAESYKSEYNYKEEN
jgi:pyoverdine/dityrosine biosynthesis protein Dit1